MFWWFRLPTRMIVLQISNLNIPFCFTDISWFVTTNPFINLACRIRNDSCKNKIFFRSSNNWGGKIILFSPFVSLLLQVLLLNYAKTLVFLVVLWLIFVKSFALSGDLIDLINNDCVNKRQINLVSRYQLNILC